MTPMYDMDEELKIRRGGKTARPIALTMRAEMLSQCLMPRL
jgi:hypothetical protein